MPSKIQLDENLWFLYICLQKSDLKTIDFTAVGASTNLKPPAARMRYTRLRRQIESGTLIGTHGTPFTGSADKIYEASTKRKRPNSSVKDDDETEDEEPLSRIGKRGKNEADVGRKGGSDKSGKNGDGKRDKAGVDGVKVKEEVESEFESDDSSFEDSEDEIPLAKLRKARLGLRQFPFSASKPYVSPYPPSRMMSPISGGFDIPRSMAGFSQDMGRMGGGQRLGSGFQSPVGCNPNFTLGNGNGGAGGWGGWARWQNRFARGEGLKGSL